jgi:16S rRNA (adenine1518-N6/adenine1519-N6)-dimethyltransferase
MATQYGVKAKKALGQHFLNDESVARRIVESLIVNAEGQTQVLEIGPGTGVLTKYLLQNPNIKLEVAEIDTESIAYLQQAYPQLLYSLQQRDFLEIPLEKIFTGEFAVIGNFPYNISSQIFFKVLDYIETIPQVVCMLQREVAQRLASGPGSKAYGILSVLLQAWYDIEYLFTVDEGVFTPPPKVKSGVIRLRRNSRTDLGCSYLLFKAVVKACFNQRRKTIRNSVKPILGKKLEDKRTGASVMVKQAITSPLLDLRPEQLSVEQFIELTKALTE